MPRPIRQATCHPDQKHFAKGKCEPCYYRDWSQSSRGKQSQKKYRDSVKRQVFNAYGGCICVGCGETDLDVLSIDHVNGGGNQHRKEIGGSGGYHIYRWLINNNYPTGYRVLCMNCQFRASLGKLEAFQREQQEALLALASVC